MTPEHLLEHYHRIADAKDAVPRLRRFVLNLAVRGKLVGDSGSKIVNVGKYRTLQNGYAFKSDWFSKSGMRLLRNANIGHGEIRWDDTVYLPEDRIDEFERFRLQEGNIVLTLDRPFIVTGTKVARIRRDDLPSLLLQRVGRFVEVGEGLSDDYLFLWINSPHFNEQINPGRSNGVPHISSKQVEASEICLPPLAEQHRIVAKVDELMALCDQLEAACRKREAIRDQLTAASLARLTTPDTGHDDFHAHARFAINALPALTARPGQITALRQTILNLAVRGKLVEQDPADEPGYSTTEIVAIRPFIPLCSEYCALALRHSDFVDYVTRLGQGTKMPRLRTEDAVVSPFPLPPLAEQRRIVAKVDELLTLCDQLETSLATTDTTRTRLLDALLHKALPTGKKNEAAA